MFFNLIFTLIGLLILSGGFVGLLMIGSSYLQKKKPSKTGIRLIAVPVCLIIVALIYFGLRELILSKPNAENLVGKYHLSKVTVPGFEQSRVKNYSLTFFTNGKYVMTPLSDIDLGETGTYKVDYGNSLNEIRLSYNDRYGGGSNHAHIDRSIGKYRIEFIVGDPDLGESYFFEKDN